MRLFDAIAAALFPPGADDDEWCQMVSDVLAEPDPDSAP